MGWRAQCEGYRGEPYSQVKEMLPKSTIWKCLDLPDNSTKLLVRSQRFKAKRNTKPDIFSQKQKFPPVCPLPSPGQSWLEPGPCPYQAQAEQGEQQEQTGTLEGWHGWGSAGAVTLPVTLPRLLPAFKLGGGTGAPIAPPFPKSLRDPAHFGEVASAACAGRKNVPEVGWGWISSPWSCFSTSPGTRAAPCSWGDSDK